MINENNYLTNIPQNTEEYGFCKVLNVRHEVIHWKHIFTEIFVRNTIDIYKYLLYLNMDLYQYIFYYTNQLRKIHHFTRLYTNNINDIVKSERSSFFKLIDLLKGNNNTIILDFDGVCTNTFFKNNLYKLCIERCNVIICTANPNVTNDWFIKNNLTIPHKIHSCRGKKSKIKRLIELNKKYDYCFYIDNEQEYLEYAWIFGLKTFIYKNNKITHFTMKTQ